MRKYGATQIHTGIIDQTQGINNISEYKNYKLNLTLSKDQISKMICRNLYDIFRIYGNRVNYDLLTIKKELDNYVFQIPLTSLFQTSMNTISQSIFS